MKSSKLELLRYFKDIKKRVINPCLDLNDPQFSMQKKTISIPGSDLVISPKIVEIIGVIESEGLNPYNHLLMALSIMIFNC